MASAVQIKQFKPFNLRYGSEKTHPYSLKRPWSYGRGYVVIMGVALVVLAGLAVMHLHQTWQHWQVRSRFLAHR